MHDVHLGGEVRQEGCFFHCRVATTDNGQHTILEEEAVAGRAVGNTATRQRILARNIHVTVLRPGRQNDSLRVQQFVVDGDNLHITRQVHRGDILVANVRTELFCLLTHVIHELGTLNTFGETGEVLNLSRRHQSATGSESSSDHDWLQTGASRVNRGRVTGRTRTNDDDIVNGRICPNLTRRAGCRLGRNGLDLGINRVHGQQVRRHCKFHHYLSKRSPKVSGFRHLLTLISQ